MGNKLDDGVYPRGMNANTCCPIVELRQYTLHPGARDKLIELFEREFIESQEALGMRIIGTFRDRNNPDRFVWLRGFDDMDSRALQLQQFYRGPVWMQHRDAANATMIDSDNVLLLRPAAPNSGFDLTGLTRAAAGATTSASGMFSANIYYLPRGTETEFAQFFYETVTPILTEHGVDIIGSFITEPHRNTFPALPVRENVNVFIWFSPGAGKTMAQALNDVSSRLSDRIEGEPELLHLEPTSRSLLRA